MAGYEVNVEEVEPMSRTYQYRKVMKPMLERKRRARINKCLDELKDLMVGALQSEGESITKLEKADVLELTVRHLRKLKQHHALAIPAQNHANEKFRAGFGHCATEVRRFVQAIPGVDLHVSGRLLNHLGQWMSQLDAPKHLNSISPAPHSPPTVVSVSIPSRSYSPPPSPEAKRMRPLQPPSHPIPIKPQQTNGVIYSTKNYEDYHQPMQISHPIPVPTTEAILPTQPKSQIITSSHSVINANPKVTFPHPVIPHVSSVPISQISSPLFSRSISRVIPQVSTSINNVVSNPQLSAIIPQTSTINPRVSAPAISQVSAALRVVPLYSLSPQDYRIAVSVQSCHENRDSSPQPTGIKVEVPQLSPVWRPWNVR